MRCEDRSPLFQWFHHRTSRRRAFFLRVGAVYGSGLLGLVLIWLFLGLFNIAFTNYFWVLVGAMLLVRLGHGLVAGAGGSKETRFRVHRLGAVFALLQQNQPGPVLQQAIARDLWECGVRGEEIIEAIALEQARDRFGAMIGGIAVLWLALGSLLCVLAWAAAEEGLGLWGWAMPIGWTALMAVVLERVLCISFQNYPQHLKSNRRQLEIWLSLRSQWADWMRLLVMLVVVVFVLCGGLALIGWIAQLVAAVAEWLGISFEAAYPFLALSIGAAFLVPAIWLRRRLRRDWFSRYRKFRRLAREFNLLLDLYARFQFMEDTDGWRGPRSTALLLRFKGPHRPKKTFGQTVRGE